VDAPYGTYRQRRLLLDNSGQRFLSAHDQINNLFNLRRDHATVVEHSVSSTQTFRVWAEICGIAAMI
jgi:putative transposase